MHFLYFYNRYVCHYSVTCDFAGHDVLTNGDWKILFPDDAQWHVTVILRNILMLPRIDIRERIKTVV